MANPENIRMNDITLTDQFIFKNVYVYTYMNVTTIIEKKGHDFEREKARVCGMVWRKEKQRGKQWNYATISKNEKVAKMNFKNLINWLTIQPTNYLSHTTIPLKCVMLI